MVEILRILGFLALICSSLSIHGLGSVRPISDAHRSAALELFDGSYASLEETYEALRTFQILGIDKLTEISRSTCPLVVEKLGSSESTTKDLFYASRVNSIIGCQIDAKTIEEIVSRLQDVVKNADSLLDFYYSVGSLLHIKNQGYDVILSDADGVFHSIKALSQSDGKWRYDSSGVETSSYAAGRALETLAGVVSLAESGVDQSTRIPKTTCSLDIHFLGIPMDLIGRNTCFTFMYEEASTRSVAHQKACINRKLSQIQGVAVNLAIILMVAAVLLSNTNAHFYCFSMVQASKSRVFPFISSILVA